MSKPNMFVCGAALAALMLPLQAIGQTAAQPGQEPRQQEETQAAPQQPQDRQGQEETQAAPLPEDAVIPVEDDQHMRARSLIGSSVLGVDGEEIGSVEDVIFSDEGQIVGIVVSSGGWLGIGDKDVGLSVEETEIMRDDTGTKSIVRTNVSQAQLEEAPSFKTKEDVEREMQRDATMPPAGGGLGRPAPAPGRIDATVIL